MLKGRWPNGCAIQQTNPKGLLLSGGEGCLVLVFLRVLCGILFLQDYGPDRAAAIVIRDSDAAVYRLGDT